MGINLRFFVPSAHADADMAGEYCNLISTILTKNFTFSQKFPFLEGEIYIIPKGKNF